MKTLADKLKTALQEVRFPIKPGSKVMVGNNPGHVSAIGGDYVDVVHDHETDTTPKSYHKSEVKHFYAKPTPAHKKKITQRKDTV